MANSGGGGQRSKWGRGGVLEPVQKEFKPRTSKAGRNQKHCEKFPRCIHRGERRVREWEKWGGTDGAFGDQLRARETNSGQM